jgi:hypothetical protein
MENGELIFENEMISSVTKNGLAVIASEFTSEAILLSVTAEARINASLDNLCRIASLHSFKISPLALRNFSLVSLAMTNKNHFIILFVTQRKTWRI